MLRRGDTTAAAMHGPDCFCNSKRGCFLHFFCFLKNTSVAHPVPLAVAHLVVRHAYLDTTVAHHAMRHGYEIAVARGPWRTASTPQKAFSGAPRTSVFLVVLKSLVASSKIASPGLHLGTLIFCKA